jgi:hypothetical protein
MDPNNIKSSPLNFGIELYVHINHLWSDMVKI